MPRIRSNAVILAVVFLTTTPFRPVLAQGSGTVVIDLLDKKTQDSLTCRVQVLNEKGRPVRPRSASQERSWSLIESPLTVRSRKGEYTYRVYRGPEYAAGGGEFELDTNSEGYDVLELPRHANMREEDWFGGDLSAHMSAKKLLQWLPAEGLTMSVQLGQRTSAAEAQEQSSVSEDRLWVESQSYFDSRPGSGLSLHHWLPPATVPKDLPSTKLLVLAKNAEQLEGALPVHAEISRLWARDVPIWLASQRIDSIQVLGTHLTWSGKGGNQFRPIVDPDPGRFRGERGPGRMLENIYWKVLDTGLRIPPSAGSGFGKIDTVPGYNRVYVSCPSLSKAAWWDGLKRGNSFVTSGPLLRVKVNGLAPGAVFSDPEKVELDVALKLTTSDPVAYLDVIYNGEKLYEARLDEYAKAGGKIPRLSVEESGWLVVRVVTERDFTYRIATTAPYYCEIAEEPRVSKSAVKFFQAWLEKPAGQIEASDQSQASKVYIDAARVFWGEKLKAANVP
ncbi:MAG: hypothetical protein AAF394_12970 [Planctomycetota bacterium]